MTSADRAWYLALPVFAIPVAGMGIFAAAQLYVLNGDLFAWGAQAMFTFLYIFPGLLLSIAVSQLLLWRRIRPRVVTTGERTVIGVLVGFTVVVALISLDRNGFIGLFLWPIIIILAISLTIAIAVGNRRLGQAPVTPPATVDPPASSQSNAAGSYRRGMND